MKKLLVTGVSGFLGSRIAAHYREKYEICAPDHSELDITDREIVMRKTAAWKPDIILHCAAVSDVGACERAPEKSQKINVDGSVFMAEAAENIRAKCLICSSDQIYFGSRFDGPHKEWEELSPHNMYGKQKRKAEEECVRINPSCVLLRLSWMYDIRTVNRAEHGDFMRTLLAKMRSKEPLLYPIHDVRGISDVNEVVRNLEKAWELPGSVYNFGSPNEKNTYETMLEVFRSLRWDTGRLQRDEEPFSKNPRNISMDQGKLNGEGIVFTRTAEALAENIRVAVCS